MNATKFILVAAAITFGPDPAFSDAASSSRSLPDAPVIPVLWTMSPLAIDCEGPGPDGADWQSPDFSPQDWEPVTVPVSNPIPGDQPGNRFFRGEFQLPDPAPPVFLHWRSDDGSWIYLNGKLLAHEGGDCLACGCVNMRCGNAVAIGGRLDLTPHLTPGRNILAVHVTNAGCCGSYFDARLLQGVALSPVDWTASAVTPDCEGPSVAGNPWNAVVFPDDDWTSVSMPHLEPIPGDASANRYYRGLFVAEPGTRYLLRWTGDDGTWAYVNGSLVGHAGGACLQGGTGQGLVDITPNLTAGVNLVAFQLTNLGGAGGSVLDAIILSVTPGTDRAAADVMKELY